MLLLLLSCRESRRIVDSIRRTLGWILYDADDNDMLGAMIW